MMAERHHQCWPARGATVLWLVLLLLSTVSASLWRSSHASAPSALDLHVRSYPLDLLPPSTPPSPGAVPPQSPQPLQAPVAVEFDVGVTAALPVLSPPTAATPPDVFLVVGIKTRVLRGVESRRVIRETWADPTQTARLGVRVVFVGCEPDLSVLTAERAAEARDAIAAEKTAHGDLWTDELQCQDSFFTLVDKAVAFYDMALKVFPTLAYAAVVDDDVYVRLDRLVALLRSDRVSTKRFYGGNSAEMKQRKPNKPVRNPESRYYLPKEMYPIEELPPFIAGAHYIVSKDVAGFVARNRPYLRGLKGLDDVTMALWALSLGVHPVFLPEFQILRTWNCTEDLISYADMAPSAIYAAHANLIHGRPFCEGFELVKWFKKYETVTFNSDDDGEIGGDVHFKWDIELDPNSSRLRISTNIEIAQESVELLYFPASGTYSTAFCNQVLPLLEAKLSILVGTNFCRFHRKLLLRFLNGLDTRMPSLRPLLTLARHNLERDAIDDAAGATKQVLLVRVIAPADNQAVFVLTECLVTAVHTDKHIVFVSEDDPNQAPSIVVAVIQAQSDSADSALIGSLIQRYNDRRTKLLVLSADGRRLTVPESDTRVILVTSDPSTTHARHLYLPHASLVLAGATRFNSVALLYPVESSLPMAARSFAVVHGKHCNFRRDRSMLDLLQKVDAVSVCGGEHSDSSYPPSQTPTDDTIDTYRGYKFVVIFEDDAVIAPGYVGEGIVMAFLAGSIPVFVGQSTTIDWLFNSKAFIHCGRFTSLSECVDYIQEVHRRPMLYDTMRSEPSVVNMTAFMEAFSWHPQVASMGADGVYDRVLVSHRLHHLLQDS